jgi:uncharacterized protein (DUF1684 family)
MRRAAVVVLLAALARLVPVAAASGPSYEDAIQKWRGEREARLKADDGWLAVAGLFWLEDGDWSFGSAKASRIVLPASAPALAGVFTFSKGETRFSLEPGVVATLAGNDKPVTSGVLRPDTSGKPDILILESLTLQVIERGGRYGIRLKDKESEARKRFPGLRWFPVRQAYRVEARWVPNEGLTTIAISNVIGQVQQLPSPGHAVFTLAGRQLTLDPVLEEPEANELFFIFRDQTAPGETYGAGRFLYSDMPKDGKVVLDFNKAYSPPCAFTPYATCPLPPKQNRLPVRIEAGEKKPAGH